jgi:hypothetical protein
LNVTYFDNVVLDLPSSLRASLLCDKNIMKNATRELYYHCCSQFSIYNVVLVLKFHLYMTLEFQYCQMCMHGFKNLIYGNEFGVKCSSKALNCFLLKWYGGRIWCGGKALQRQFHYCWCTYSPFEKKVYDVPPRLLFFYYVHDYVQIYLFGFYLFNFNGMIQM